MKKVFFLLLAVLCFGVKMPNVHAEAARASVSYGNLIYEGSRGSASLYAADIRFLEEKISAIPERCFDPAFYAHIHNWEYCRINENTHTRHCAECGDANDLTSSHRADSWKRDTIIYKGKGYPGKRFTCACGYQWSMETGHTPVYEVVDEMNHRSRCALDGTPYCRGCEPSLEEHYAWYYEMEEDGSHHEKICFDCGFRMEETCSFEKADEDDDLSVCICGRIAERKEESETPDKPETGDPPEAADESESEETPGTSDESGSEEAPGTGDTPETPDPPGTPDEPGDEDMPATPDEPGHEEAPGTGDTPETPDPPGTPDEPETEETLEEIIYGLSNKIA